MHISKSSCASLELGSLKPQIKNIHILFFECCRKHDKASLFPIIIKETSEGNALRFFLNRLSWRRFRHLHLQSIEIRVQINDSISYRTIRSCSIAIHELNLKAPSIVLIAAIYYKLEDIVKFRIFPSLLYHCSWFLLVWEFDVDIWIHAKNWSCLMLDHCFQ